MVDTFKHSQKKLPRLYKEAGRILQKVKEEGGSLKTLVYSTKHSNLKGLYALVLETLRHGQQLDHLIRKTEILLKNPRLNPWVTRVLMTELLWQKKALSTVSPPLEIVQSYQEQFLSELANIPKDEGIKDASNPSNTARQIRYVRVNTLKETVENVINWFVSSGWEKVNHDFNNKKAFVEKVENLKNYQFMKDPDVPNLLIFPSDFKFYETELFSQAVIQLQDKASCVPPILLNSPAGSVVLDMCAAPGMKTSQIAALIDNKGKVNAVEINQRRYATLCETVEQSGATCVKTINGDVLRHSGQDMPDVQFILLDPPCSGSGMISRKNIFAEEETKDKFRLSKLANFQCSLLRHAMTNFPNAKRIVYSTCSVHPEENEAVVDSVLKSIPPNFVPVRDPPFTSWMTRASADYEFGSCGFYAYPSTHLTNGFYVIVFDRSDNEYVSSLKSSTSDSSKEEKKGTKKKKRKALEEGKNSEGKEKKSSKPDDMVQKVFKAMQKKSEPYQTETDTSVEKCKKSHSKKKIIESKTEEDISKSVRDQNTSGDVVKDFDLSQSEKTSKKKKKKSKPNSEGGSVEKADELGVTELAEERIDIEGEGDDPSHSEKRKRKHSSHTNGKKKKKK